MGIAALASINRNSGTFLPKEVLIQSAALIIGLALALVILVTGYRYFLRLDRFIYPLAIAMLLSVYIPGLGTSFYGSRSWLDLGFVTFQPSEIVKILFVILMASCLSTLNNHPSSAGAILKAALYALPFILIVAKEDFGTGCVFCAIWIFMVFCSSLDMKIIGRVALALAMLLPVFYFFLASYQKERIEAFLNPGDLELASNYQVWNSKVAIGSGGLLGKGYMHGTQACLGFLPVPESDFIFAAIVEETGFPGGMVIILLFCLLLFHTLKTAKYSSHLQGTLISVGLAGMFFFQALENIAMCMGLMPVTGITLPFVSYGGSSMISSMMGTGLILSVSRSLKI